MSETACKCNDGRHGVTAESEAAGLAIAESLQAFEHQVLRRRIADICAGALGGRLPDGYVLDLDEASRVIPVLQEIFPELPEAVWFPENLGHFTDVESIADFFASDAGA